MNAIQKRLFAADLAACIALSDARKAENAATRARMQNNPELRAELLAQAFRRGESEIDWAEYSEPSASTNHTTNGRHQP